MATSVLVTDKTLASNLFRDFTLEFPTDRTTVREFIRTRVYREVLAFNASGSDTYMGLVKPTDTEETLNGYKLIEKRLIDWEEQYKLVIEAFELTRIILLVDDKQMEDLDQEIPLRDNQTVVFLKLVPLVGG